MLAFIEITLIWHEKYTKNNQKHYRDNIEYRDILTHDNRHQLFLISPIPTPSHSPPIPPHPALPLSVARENEIIMPDEHTGVVRENYKWKVRVTSKLAIHILKHKYAPIIISCKLYKITVSMHASCIDGFHSIFSLGNWGALHHHAPC